MATKKKKKDTNVILMNAAKAAGGGIGGAVISELLAKQFPEKFEEMDWLTEAVPIGAGVAGLFFLPDDWHPAAYGAIGAGASGWSDEIMAQMEGFARVRHLNGAEADELAIGIETLDGLQTFAFEDEYGDGMSA